MYRVAKLVMYQGGFNLRKWNSNSLGLLDLIRNSECEFIKSTGMTNVDNLKEPTTEVISEETCMCILFGVYWNNLSNELTFIFNELIQLFHKLRKTKRSV